MADNSLSLVSESEIASVLTPGDIDTINGEIDKYIAAHKNSRHEINRLVFDSVANITEAEEAGRRLASKGFFSRLIGGITGSNAALQNKINSSRAASQYAAQQTLQKLAEQNVMTFDMIAAVNNKLNQSMLLVGEEFKRVYAGLAAFLNKNRSEMARMEARLQRVERNVNILNWQSTIEYLEWDGVPYNDLDTTSKIVCVTRDFYEITNGEWTLSDLLLLKSAMSMVGVDVKGPLNYFDTLLEIAETPRLKDKLLGGGELKAIEDPSYVVFMGGMKKLELLAGDEKYIVDTVAEFIGEDGQSEDGIRADLADKYLTNRAGVNANTSIEAYELVLDLLYNLKQATDEDMLTLSGADARIKAEQLLEEAYKYAENGDHNAAFKCFKQAAKLGNADAMYKLGDCFVNGDGVDKSDEKAVEWFRKAAELGNADAMFELGDCFYYGIGVDKSKEKAVEWYLKAAELGVADAMYKLGDCFTNGDGVDKSDEKAVEWFRKAAELGNADAMYNLAVCFLRAKGVEQSDKMAEEWLLKAMKLWLKAAERGNADAMYKLGEYYYWYTFDKEKAVEWYLKAAELGNDVAMYKLGECFSWGNCVERSYEKAAEWYLKAAELGNADAMNKLGFCFSLGEGVDKSKEKARGWYLKAAELGNADAMCSLGDELYLGYTISKSYEKAVEWYRKAAEHGNAKGMHLLGHCFDNGYGVEQSYEKAIEWYLKAAELGNAKAMYNLGVCYENGRGIQKDMNEAVGWYRKAAGRYDGYDAIRALERLGYQN